MKRRRQHDPKTIGKAIRIDALLQDKEEGYSVATVFRVLLAGLSLGLLSLIGMWRLSRWFLDMSVRYVRFNLHIIKK